MLLRSLTICALGVLICATPAFAEKDQVVSFEAPRDLLNGKTRRATFAELDSLGVRSLRVVLYWKDVAPQPQSRIRPDFDQADPSAYDWSKYEPALAEAKARGWNVLLTVTGPVPLWASNGARSETYMPRSAYFKLFLEAVSKRLGKYVSRYAIYNEPNHPKFLTPQFDSKGNPVSPQIYRGLYAAATEGLAATGNTKPILMGETSPRGTRDAVPPLRFLRESLCLTDKFVPRSGCELLQIDGWATHPYTGKSPFLKRVPKDDITIGTLNRLTVTLDRAAKAGVIEPNLPIYLTEFGMQSRPDPLGVTLLRQAEYRAIAEKIAWENPRVVWFAQYLLRDDNPRKGRPSDRFGGFETGLRQADGKIKPSLAAFRLPLVVKRAGASVALWGLVRPGGKQTVVVQQRDGSGPWQQTATVATNNDGYWAGSAQYARRRAWRVRWTRADGHTFVGPETRAYR